MVTQVAEIDETPLEVLNDSLSEGDPKETRCNYFSVSFILLPRSLICFDADDN